MKKLLVKLGIGIGTVLLSMVILAYVFMGTEYVVEVTNGSGGGNYQSGKKVTLIADESTEDREFLEWRVEYGEVTIDDATKERISFQMPEMNVGLKAVYKETWTDVNGNTYIGVKKDNKITGAGTAIFGDRGRYDGEFVGGIPSGTGTLYTYYTDGSVKTKYEGSWLSGQFYGTGTFWGYQEDGVLRMKYSGEWKFDKQQGNGTEWWYPDDPQMYRKYVGEWDNGMRNGNGVLYASDDTRIYEGEWVDGYFSGQGKYIDSVLFEMGEVVETYGYEGEFAQGKRSGTGTGYVWDKDGYVLEKYDGEWAEDQASGSGVYEWYDEKGKLTERHEGEFEYGMVSGEGIRYWYDEDGNVETKFEGSWIVEPMEESSEMYAYHMDGTFYWYNSKGEVINEYQADKGAIAGMGQRRGKDIRMR